MRKDNLARLALRYGPVVYALAQKHGPMVVEQIMRRRDPTYRLIQDRAARVRTNPRKQALAHADTVIEGTLQQVFHAGRPYWVIFSRGEPVGVHPHTTIPFETLLRNADPARRVSPADLRRTIHVPRRRKG